VKEAVNTAQKYLDRESSDRLAQVINVYEYIYEHHKDKLLIYSTIFSL
jgi:hypothetical protein